MRLHHIASFTGGWFIGNFDPAALQASEVEICLKRYRAGEREPEHFQMTVTEFTLVVAGSCRLGDWILKENEILEIPPMKSADFEALTDCVVVAVKTPSIPGDKVLGAPRDR